MVLLGVFDLQQLALLSHQLLHQPREAVRHSLHRLLAHPDVLSITSLSKPDAPRLCRVEEKQQRVGGQIEREADVSLELREAKLLLVAFFGVQRSEVGLQHERLETFDLRNGGEGVVGELGEGGNERLDEQLNDLRLVLHVDDGLRAARVVPQQSNDLDDVLAILRRLHAHALHLAELPHEEMQQLGDQRVVAEKRLGRVHDLPREQAVVRLNRNVEQRNGLKGRGEQRKIYFRDVSSHVHVEETSDLGRLVAETADEKAENRVHVGGNEDRVREGNALNEAEKRRKNVSKVFRIANTSSMTKIGTYSTI